MEVKVFDQNHPKRCLCPEASNSKHQAKGNTFTGTGVAEAGEDLDSDEGHGDLRSVARSHNGADMGGVEAQQKQCSHVGKDRGIHS